MKICSDCNDYEIRLISLTYPQKVCTNAGNCRPNSPHWIGKTYEYCGWCRHKFEDEVQMGVELKEICCDDYKLIMREILDQQMFCGDSNSCRKLKPKFDGKYGKPFKYCPWCGGNLQTPPPGHRQDYASSTTFNMRENLDAMRNWKKNDNISDTN